MQCHNYSLSGLTWLNLQYLLPYCMMCVTGYVVVLPCIDRWVTVDLRTKAFSVPPQMVSRLSMA